MRPVPPAEAEEEVDPVPEADKRKQYAQEGQFEFSAKNEKKVLSKFEKNLSFFAYWYIMISFMCEFSDAEVRCTKRGM